jgi:hypothetical protein
MKKYILSISFLAMQLAATAQTVNVHFKNGQTIEYPAANVDYVDFSAKASAPTVTAGQVVDLGLSVFWASCNLGAESPEEYGDYYAWGETKPKTSYTETNYAYYDDNLKQYTDIGVNISGTQYDAATVNLGGDWRMPTKDEMEELIDNCTWEWIQTNGKNGFKVTGKNGNSIFLPAAGCHAGPIISQEKEILRYLTGIRSKSINFVNTLIASSTLSPNMTVFDSYFGLPIRPVTTNVNAGGTPIDHSQDYLVTEKISASYNGGAFSIINGRIQSGSVLKFTFKNGSSETVKLMGVQIKDATDSSYGNNILNEQVDVAAGESKPYSITLSKSMTTPTICFTYVYNSKKYMVEATYQSF